MMVHVVYSSGMHDMVKTEVLNRLLASGEVLQFKRTNGWVNVGLDPIRQIRQENYPADHDRRHRFD